jgi:hypothetical protein
MKKTTMLMLCTTILLSGCTHRYVVTLNNRNQVTAHGKPKFDRGYYVFKDAQGKEVRIAAGRVSDITRESLAKKAKDPRQPETK